MTVEIVWTPNPLAAIVVPDDDARRRMLLSIENEMLSEDVAAARYWLDKGDSAAAAKALGTSEEDPGAAERRLSDYLSALRGTHLGDCTCVPCTCVKCWAESAVGVNTLRGLTKYLAHKVAGAFGEDGGRSLDEAIAALASYDPKPWPGNQEVWQKCLPRWKKEAEEAHAWLVAYRSSHFSPRALPRDVVSAAPSSAVARLHERLAELDEAVARMAPVVRAADGWYDDPAKGLGSRREHALAVAVAAYRRRIAGLADPGKDPEATGGARPGG